MKNNDNGLATAAFFKAVGVDWLVQKSDLNHSQGLQDLITGLIKKSEKVLDICCGYGRISIPLIKNGYKIQGIDISPELIERANSDLIIESPGQNKFIVGDMRNLPYEDAEFDFVFCVWASFNFLSTFDDQLKCLAQVKRVLKKGGRLLIECPFHEKFDGVKTFTELKHSYEYFPLTKEHLNDLGLVADFDSADVSDLMISNRHRIVATFTK